MKVRTRMYQVTEITAQVIDRSTYSIIEKQVLALVDENGNRDGARHTFELNETAKAQEMCDYLNSEETQRMNESADKLFGALFSNTTGHDMQSYGTEQPASAQPELPEEIIIAGKNEAATIIEYKGSQWFVAGCEYESEVTPADTRDEMDERLPIGWHSWLVKVQPGNKALEVVAELVKDGKATLNSSQTVMFPDEQYSSFLRDMAYSEELGLYDRSKVNER